MFRIECTLLNNQYKEEVFRKITDYFKWNDNKILPIKMCAMKLKQCFESLYFKCQHKHKERPIKFNSV